MATMFLLENPQAGYFGNSPCWWRKGGSGYTPYVDEAERFTLEEANNTIRSTWSSHKFVKWPESLVLKHVRQIIDTQSIPLSIRPRNKRCPSLINPTKEPTHDR